MHRKDAITLQNFNRLLPLIKLQQLILQTSKWNKRMLLPFSPKRHRSLPGAGLGSALILAGCSLVQVGSDIVQPQLVLIFPGSYLLGRQMWRGLWCEGPGSDMTNHVSKHSVSHESFLRGFMLVLKSESTLSRQEHVASLLEALVSQDLSLSALLQPQRNLKIPTTHVCFELHPISTNLYDMDNNYESDQKGLQPHSGKSLSAVYNNRHMPKVVSLKTKQSTFSTAPSFCICIRFPSRPKSVVSPSLSWSRMSTATVVILRWASAMYFTVRATWQQNWVLGSNNLPPLLGPT